MKTLKIADIEIKNRYVQAPLAGYTNFSMREMGRRYGAGLTYTEMTSSTALVYGNKRTFDMIPNAFEQGPVAFQLFGGKKEDIIKSIPLAENYGKYDILDFNAGCPVKKVIKQEAGSFWLTREEELYDLARAMVEVSSKPVTFKIRLGYTSEEKNYLKVAKVLEAAGVSAIAVHGRTRAQMYCGETDYDAIREIKESVSIPIIASGNINLDNFNDIDKIISADGYMFGRASIGNPKIFEDLINLENGDSIREYTKEEKMDDIVTHLNLLIDEVGEVTACKLMRGFAVMYLKGLRNIRPYKNELVQACTKKEYMEALDKIKNND